MSVERTRTLFGNLSRSFTNTKHRITGVTGRMAEAMASMANAPRVVFARTVSSLAIVTGELSTTQGDAESQDDNKRTNPPTAMFTMHSGSGELGVNGDAEKRKLSDLGKDAEFPIPQDRPLHLNTEGPAAMAGPSSAGNDSTPEGVSGTSIEPALPRNARFRAAAKKVSITI